MSQRNLCSHLSSKEFSLIQQWVNKLIWVKILIRKQWMLLFNVTEGFSLKWMLFSETAPTTTDENPCFFSRWNIFTRSPKLTLLLSQRKEKKEGNMLTVESPKAPPLISEDFSTVRTGYHLLLTTVTSLQNIATCTSRDLVLKKEIQHKSSLLSGLYRKCWVVIIWYFPYSGNISEMGLAI